MFKKIITLLFFVQLASALSLIEPLQTEAGEAPVYLGVVGPGQTIELQFLRDTGVAAAINPTTGKNALWDMASVVQSTLPNRWLSKDSLKYETPLTVFITTSETNEKKNYTFSVGFVDEYEGTAPTVANFMATIDPDVLEIELEKSTVYAGVGQPALFKLIARSKSSASDTFTISAEGLPYDWQFTKTFFLPHGEEKEVYFEVIGNIQKEVSFEITVTSLSSEEIKQKATAKVITSSNLIQDAKAASLGLPLFPSVEQHVYSLFGLVANLLFK